LEAGVSVLSSGSKVAPLDDRRDDDDQDFITLPVPAHEEQERYPSLAQLLQFTSSRRDMERPSRSYS
jgi:hypothetical protein